MRYRTKLLAGMVLCVCAIPSGAQSVSEIANYREYSPIFASAGQPTEAQLPLIAEADFERVIYIAFSNSGNAIANEDELVRGLGMDYLQIPVVWDAPSAGDFNAFAAVMQSAPERKTLLHCQVNMRASVFAFLYRVIYEDVPVAVAKADMNTVWQPNAIWRDLIFDVLNAHQISPDCADCSWDVPD